MSRSRGRRYDEGPRKLNIKKVVATIIVIIGIIMIILSIKNLLTNEEKTKDVSTLTTYISVLENNKWGVIDNKGNIIIDLKYDEMVIVPDKNEPLFICTDELDYNTESYTTIVLNEKGNEVLGEYSEIVAVENNDISNVWYEENVLKHKKDGKFGLINFEGKEIVKPIYDEIYALEGVENSIILVKDIHTTQPWDGHSNQ